MASKSKKNNFKGKKNNFKGKKTSSKSKKIDSKDKKTTPGDYKYSASDHHALATGIKYCSSGWPQIDTDKLAQRLGRTKGGVSVAICKAKKVFESILSGEVAIEETARQATGMSGKRQRSPAEDDGAEVEPLAKRTRSGGTKGEVQAASGKDLGHEESSEEDEDDEDTEEESEYEDEGAALEQARGRNSESIAEGEIAAPKAQAQDVAGKSSKEDQRDADHHHDQEKTEDELEKSAASKKDNPRDTPENAECLNAAVEASAQNITGVKPAASPVFNGKTEDVDDDDDDDDDEDPLADLGRLRGLSVTLEPPSKAISVKREPTEDEAPRRGALGARKEMVEGKAKVDATADACEDSDEGPRRPQRPRRGLARRIQKGN